MNPNDAAFNALKDVKPTWLEKGIPNPPFRPIERPNYIPATLNTGEAKGGKGDGGDATRAEWPAGGGGVSLKPFELVRVMDGPTQKTRVVYSTLADQAPIGFSPGDDPPYLLSAGESSYVYGVVTISWDRLNHSVTSRTIGYGGSVPASSAIPTGATGTSTHYIEIGSHDEDGNPINARYGPIILVVNSCEIAYSSPVEYNRTVYFL